MSLGPTIETLDDYNQRLENCECCEIPSFGPPSIYRQLKSNVESDLCGQLMFILRPDALDYDPAPSCEDYRSVYRSYRYDGELYNYENDGLTYYNYAYSTWTRELDGSCTFDIDSDGEWDFVSPDESKTRAGTVFTAFETYIAPFSPFFEYTATEVFDFDDKITEGDAQREMIENLDAVASGISWSAASTFNTCVSNIVLESTLSAFGAQYFDGCPDSTSDLPTAPYFGRDEFGRQPVWISVRYTYQRYKWQVPDGFEGTFCKVTYDVVYVPLGYDPEDPGTPQPEILLADQTYEWTGPGDPEDPDSWLFPSDWISFPRPDDFGKVEIANFRYQWLQDYPPNVCGPVHEIPPP